MDGDGDGTARCDVGSVELQVASVVEVPTLGATGLALLALLLGSWAAALLRRRRLG